jgi:hypothetical protein
VLAYLSIVNLRQKQKATGWFNCPADGLFRKNARPKESQAGLVMPAPIIMPMLRKVSIETKWILFQYRTARRPFPN